MSYLRRLWLIIVRRSYHSLCLFLLAFLFACFMILATFFSGIVEAYEELVIQDIGYVLNLSSADETPLTQEQLHAIAHTSGVSGINFAPYGLAEPLNFQNAVADAEAGANAFDRIQSDQIKLVGNLHVDQNHTLQTHGTLVDGYYPDEDHAGLLISTELAERNALSLGDQLTMFCDGANEPFCAPIVGIYQLTVPIQETLPNPNGYEISTESPYSYLFCDLPTYEAAKGFPFPLTGISIYAQNRRQLKAVAHSLRSAGYDLPNYFLLNTTEERIVTGTLSSRSITTFASIMNWIATITALLVVFLLILLWMRNNYKDSAILISLGCTRLSIVLDYFVLLNLIVCTAMALVTPLCVILLQSCGDELIGFALSVLRDSALVETDVLIEAAFRQKMDLMHYLRADLELLVITWLAAAAASVEIFRCRPTVLFRAS